MTRFRHSLRAHRMLVAMFLAAILVLRLLVPAGFMPVADGAGRLTVMVCSGEGSRAMSIDIPGLGDAAGKSAPREHDKPGAPCAFAGLSAPWLGGVDPAMLLLALAFVAVAALRRDIVALPSRTPRLRPPLRGPPVPSIA